MNNSSLFLQMEKKKLEDALNHNLEILKNNEVEVNKIKEYLSTLNLSEDEKEGFEFDIKVLNVQSREANKRIDEINIKLDYINEELSSLELNK